MNNINVTQNKKHAIVIGASMAGLWAARILADHFDRVTVLERDQLTSASTVRAGVPQAKHAHVLLARGVQALTKYFPALDEELIAAGATPMDWTADMKLMYKGRWMQRPVSGVMGRSISRATLEAGIRRHLVAMPHMRFVSGADVAEPCASDGTVTGVRVQWRGQVPDDYQVDDSATTMLTADLVVDASGRNSRTPQWLEALGYAAPAETVVNSFLGYASRRYERPAHLPLDWRVMLVTADAPHNPRSGVIFQEEDGNWIVTLTGAARDYPPTDEAGFRAFAQTLTPEFYAAFKDARPLTPIAGYRKTENQLRHYDQLVCWPDGFVVMGDALCAFNPVYGQGMTSGILAALALDECLAAAQGDLTGVARRFQKRAAQVVQPIWVMATAEDYRWPTTEGGTPDWRTRFMHWYLDRLSSVTPDSEYLTKTFHYVYQLVEPPTTLFKPGVLLRVFGRPLLRKTGNVPDQPPFVEVTA